MAAITLVRLTEFVANKSALTVDRDAGVIRGVKILGLESANGRRYTTEAIRKAAGLYENRAVNVNHPARPSDPRSAYDRFGRIANPVPREDGLYGDLHYLKTHPLAGPLTEAAERMPSVFGLSHNVTGRERKDGGVSIIETIESVASVDVVADPATTSGLFEHKEQQTMKRTIKSVLESVYTGASKRKLLEDLPTDAMGAEMELPADAPADDQVGAAFKAMVMSVLDDSSLDIAAKKTKIGDILKAQEKLMAKPEPPATEETPADEGKHAETTNKQLQEEIASFRREKKIRALSSEAGVTLTEQQVTDLSLVSDEAAVKRFLEALKPVKNGVAPKSGRVVPVTEAKLPEVKTAKDFASACFSR